MTEVVQVGKATEVRTCKLGTIVTHKACWDAMGGEETMQLGDNAGRRRGTQRDDVKKSREVVNYQEVHFTIMLHQITANGVPWELRVRNRLKWRCLQQTGNAPTSAYTSLARPGHHIEFRANALHFVAPWWPSYRVARTEARCLGGMTILVQ